MEGLAEMRLRKEEVGLLCKNIVEKFISGGVIELKTEREKVFKKMEEIFIDELMVEDRLDEEVSKILESHKKEVQSGKIDYQKMFNMIKRQIERERGLIL